MKGVGNYTAGAISSFVYNIPKPAVDGNVLRVVSRITADDGDITKASVKAKIENEVEEVIPAEAAGDFNQSLIELGAIICVPNGEPRCGICPVKEICLAHMEGRETEFPVKKKKKERRIEKRTVLVFRDNEKTAVRKRAGSGLLAGLYEFPGKEGHLKQEEVIEKRTVLVFRDNEKTAVRKRAGSGLLAGLYEFPGKEGHLKQEEVIEYARELGLMPVRVKKLGPARHIFSHVEWHMVGYEVIVDELEKKYERFRKKAGAG